MLMGIVNVTPDSFSDGGAFLAHDAAVRHALDLIAAGADVVDVGGESTRPGAEPVSIDEERRRVVPVIESLAARTNVPISIDTSKPEVARAAVEAGAQIINDVTALVDDAMVDVARDTRSGVCAMHMLGTPRTMQDAPHYADVVAEVVEYLRSRRDALEAAGIPRARVCLDPGIGFGKTFDHNRHLLAHCGRLHELGCPVLIGHSRKALLGALLGDEKADRTAATVGVALAVARQGVQLVRVHDVRPVRDALLAFDAVGGISGG